jgi:hypothetical protein
MREAGAPSNATEILAIERPDLPVGIANGALLLTRIVADDIGSVSYPRRSFADPTPTCIWPVCRIRNIRVKDAKELSFLPDVTRCALCIPSDRNSISRAFLHERWVWPVRSSQILRLVDGHLHGFWVLNVPDQPHRLRGTPWRRSARSAAVSAKLTLYASVSDYHSSGMLVRNVVATATASILSVRVAMLSRASRKATLEAALQNVT